MWGVSLIELEEERFCSTTYTASFVTIDALIKKANRLKSCKPLDQLSVHHAHSECG
jgi:hypothetical protein